MVRWFYFVCEYPAAMRRSNYCFLFFCIIGPVRDPPEIVYLGVSCLYQFLSSLGTAVPAPAVYQDFLFQIRQFFLTVHC